MLLTRVQDVMTPHIPMVPPDAIFADVIDVMTKGRMGLAVVIENTRAIGIITDGDVRRAFSQHTNTICTLVAKYMMSAPPLSIAASAKLEAAKDLLSTHHITALVVHNGQGEAVGVLNLHDVR
jgi:arabinose-5-phosphate isomerase